jgi:4-hydroxythreonine-4-phosphate dehydrogenase
MPFKKISKKSNKFIFECFEIAIDLINKKKIFGIINGPISKETLLTNKFSGITEYLSFKTGTLNKEVMLIYNKKLAVSPITTHIPVQKISSLLNIKKIINNVKTIVKFYNKILNKKIKIGITGLNPHCYSPYKNTEEELIIKPAIKLLKKKNFDVLGPLSPDTAFVKKNLKRFDVIIGMYHDQILAPIKTLFEQKAINITLGIPFIRISPDHGVGADIVGKNKADPTSLIECLQFFKNIK